MIRDASEADVLRAVRQYLDLRGAVYVRNNTGMLFDRTGRPVRFGREGSADLIVCGPGGRFVSCEVKGRDGKLTPAQQAWALAVLAAGGAALTVRSVEELIHELSRLEGA